jgi:hypothetical protein
MDYSNTKREREVERSRDGKIEWGRERERERQREREREENRCL